MQTIIYTNCKRQAANYQVDKMQVVVLLRCFTDRVDMGQIIQEEMNKYNIRNIHFWMITDNISNIQNVTQHKLLIAVAKYLIENKDMSFQVQFIVEKYTSYFQSTFTKQQSGNEVQYQNIKRHKTAMNLTCNQFSESCPIPNQANRKSEENAFQLSKSRLIQQSIIQQILRQPTLAQFEDFMKKQAKFHIDSESIKKYIFTTSNQSITISFIQPNKKNLIKKIIEQNCDRFYDAKLGIKKKSTFQQTFSYQDRCKSLNHRFGTTQTLYNKVVLFLFSADKNQKLTLNRRRTKLMQNKLNPSIEVLSEWKIKQENVDMICKLQKECDLIKQEIQNQKILFRNKIKIIQNFIGQSINLQKLMQEEEEIQSNNQLMLVTAQKKQTFGKMDSVISPQSQQVSTPSRFSVNNPYTTYEFKRLKDISDAMRNIDNTLLQQNKKIQSAHKKIKDLIKNKESIIFTNASELNKLRQIILQAKSEIARKQIQITQKQKNGTISQIIQYKSKEPSSIVKVALQKYEQFCNNINIVKIQDPTEDLLTSNNKIRHRVRMDAENRIIQKSLHCDQFKKINISLQCMNSKLKEKRMNEVQTCLTRLTHSKKQDFFKTGKLLEKGLIVGHQSLNEPAQQTQSYSQNIPKIQQQIKIQKYYEQLVALFEYYNQNIEIENQMMSQLQNYKSIRQQPLTTFMKQIKNKDKNFSYLSNLHLNQSEMFLIENQLQLEDFPILKQHILKKIDLQKTKKINNMKNAQQSKAKYKQQLKYTRDYFQIMLYGKNKQKKNEALMKTVTTIKSQLYDKIIQEPSQIASIDKNQVPRKQFPKQKRITIQQAIKLSSHFNSKKNK